MHNKAITKIHAHVEGSVRNTRIDKNWLVYESFQPHVISLAKEVVKHKSDCVDISDVFDIFYDLVSQPLGDHRSTEEPVAGDLTTIIGKVATEQLCTALTHFFVSLPREYDVYLPIPKLKGLSSIDISDRFSIVVFSDDDEIPGQPDSIHGPLAGMRKALKKDLTYFKYQVSGYCGTRLESNTMLKAATAFKISLQQLLHMNIIEISPDQSKGIGFFRDFGNFSVPRHSLFNADLSAEPLQIKSASLPMEFCRTIDAIKLKEGHQENQRAIENSTLPELFGNRLRFPSMLMENSDPEAERIRAAVEWCFDSYSFDNTVAFLQVCIGLEAILGEDRTTDALTRSLADRCAYLTASDIKSRQTIRKNFMDLYKIRSSLVHGTQRTLDKKQAHFLYWGREILEYCIFKEIQNLNMGGT